MGTDWDAVAAAINARLAELKMTQRELSESSGVSVATLRQLQNNYQPRRRSPRLLAAISDGLRWSPDHLAKILEGTTPDEASNDLLRRDVRRLEEEVRVLRDRVAALEGSNGRG